MADTRRDLTMWMLVVTVVLLAGNLIRGEQVSDNVDRGRAAATVAAAAAEKASADLTAAIENSQNSDQIAAFQRALKAMIDTHDIICAAFPDECEQVSER